MPVQWVTKTSYSIESIRLDSSESEIYEREVRISQGQFLVGLFNSCLLCTGVYTFAQIPSKGSWESEPARLVLFLVRRFSAIYFGSSRDRSRVLVRFFSEG